MKKFGVLLIALFLVTAGSSLQQAFGQEKTKAEIEKEQKIQQAIEEQKKAIIEQKKVQAEAELEYKDQQAKMEEALKDVRVRVESSGRGGDGIRIYTPRGGRSISVDDPFIFSSDYAPFSLHSIGESERTTWDLSRSLKENSFSKEYSFDVDKTAKNVVMSVMGDCKAGEIRIKIEMPNGKNYSDVVIDEFGNLNWRKSFSITESENQDKTGEWKFVIESTKASGYFKISLQIN